VAYVAGEPALWPQLTVADTLTFLGNVRGARDTQYEAELLARFKLDPARRVRALSKGNRQKVQLVSAFASRARLLLLDEPTSGLDPLMEVAFRDTVREATQRGQTVFLSSHILSEVESLCDRVGILRDGRLVEEGRLDELRHLHAQQVEVGFAGAAPELEAPAGVVLTRTGPSTVHAEVTGPVGPLLTLLAPCDVVSFTTRTPSLEEIFLHHYADQAPA
jgi:ABC-2 type transport system ATP-binding protein